MPKAAETALTPAESLLQTLDIHFRVTRYLLESIEPKAWLLPTPDGKGRNLAALAAHIHSVHLMWLKAAGSSVIPDPLDKAGVTIPQAIQALERSAALLHNVVAASLASGERIKNFKPDTTAFVGYLISHDSHHRGQISMLARQLGFPLPRPANYGLWEWGVR